MTVKEIRQTLKISQSKFAAILGVESQTISAWEIEKTFPNEINQLKLLELEQKIINNNK